MNEPKTVHIWRIGADRTEFYAAHSEEEMRRYYIEQVGPEQAAEDFLDCFEEVPTPQLDKEFDYDEDGVMVRMTLRKLIAHDCVLPTQISTGYN